MVKGKVSMISKENTKERVNAVHPLKQICQVAIHFLSLGLIKFSDGTTVMKSKAKNLNKV